MQCIYSEGTVYTAVCSVSEVYGQPILQVLSTSVWGGTMIHINPSEAFSAVPDHGNTYLLFEPTCAYAQWAHMHRFLSVT